MAELALSTSSTTSGGIRSANLSFFGGRGEHDDWCFCISSSSLAQFFA